MLSPSLGELERSDAVYVCLSVCESHSLSPTDQLIDQVVREALQDDRKVMTKSCSVDLVTQTDQKVEQLIIQSVKEKFPTHR